MGCHEPVMELSAIESLIRKRLSAERYQHSVQVAEAAARLAGLHAEDEYQARLAGLLHDYGKSLDAPNLVVTAESMGMKLSAEDRLLPDLLHGPVGALLAAREVGINNPQILSAISSHTMGGMDMSSLDKIIFLADMIEPGRDYPLRDRLACLCERDLDRAMILGLDLTIRYCLEQGRLLHPQTVAVRNHFLILFPDPHMC